MEKIDVVIPFRSDEEKWDELKYALRSFEKHFKQLGNIWILGTEKPYWSKNLEFNGFTDELKHNKDGNIMYKIYYHCLLEKTLTDNFVFLSDDQVILKDLTASDLYPRYCVDLEKYQFKEVQNRWKQRLRNISLKKFRIVGNNVYKEHMKL